VLNKTLENFRGNVAFYKVYT